MPKSSKPWVLVYPEVEDANDHPTLCPQVCGSEEEAKALFAELADSHSGEVWLFREQPTPAEVDIKPRVTFGVAHKPLGEKKRGGRPKGSKNKPKENGEVKLVPISDAAKREFGEAS